MQAFSEIYARASDRKGGNQALEALVATNVPSLESQSDAQLLSRLSQAIFNAGFNWKVVAAKWPGTEDALQGFDIDHCATLGAEELMALKADARVIGNGPKLATIPENAVLFQRLRDEHGSVASFLASWPADDMVGLWAYLKANGSRIGGMTGPYWLRNAGVDTFILSQSVTDALIAAGVVTKKPTGKGALKATQDAFNAWHAESGRPYRDISRVLAFSVP